MPKGPNSFFIPPDMELIKDGSIYSSNDGTGNYSGACVPKSTNKGSLFGFMTGTPSAGTTLDLQIVDSGSSGTATYAYKKGTSLESGGIDSWYGEPDRRYMWDVHNPLLNDISTVNAGTAQPSTSDVAEDAQITNETVLLIKGVYFSVTNKEYLFIRYDNQSNYKIQIYSRPISNTEQNWTNDGEINIQETGNNRGLGPKDVPVFDVCEHTDGKLKLVVRSVNDIDLYESTDGVTFVLVAKQLMSRFLDFRHFLDMKIASSGPYLKIVYGRSATGIQPQARGYKIPPVYLGGMISSDDGATWVGTEVPWDKNKFGKVGNLKEVYGDGITTSLVNASFGAMNLNYDLCGLTDGSGRFLLSTNNINYSNFSYTIFVVYVSDGPSKFVSKNNLALLQNLSIGKCFLGCNNDWIWMIIAGSDAQVRCGWSFMGGIGSSNTACDTYTGSPGSNTKFKTNENSILYLNIFDDLNVESWKMLGANDIMTREQPTSGGKGSYFFVPGGGNFYSCGPYMAFVAMANVVGMGFDANSGENESDTSNFYSYQHQAQYFRLSGWNFRPPYANLGHWQELFPTLPERIFRHQALGVITQPEFNYIWGKPAEIGNQGNTPNNTLWANHQEFNEINHSIREDGMIFQENIIPAAHPAYKESCNFQYFKCPSVISTSFWSSGGGQTEDPLVNTYRYNTPKFPDSMSVTKQHAPQHSWIAAPIPSFSSASLGAISDSRTPGCCIIGVFGGVVNGSSSKNSIGVRLNSYIYDTAIPGGASGSNVFVQMTAFLRMSGTKLSLYDISDDSYSSVYRENTTQLICEVEPSTGTYGANPFSNLWWEFRLSIFPNYSYQLQNPTTTEHSPYLCSRILLEVRKIGTETWISSGVVLKPTYTVLNGVTLSPWKNRPSTNTNSIVQFGTQEIAFGLFKDSGGQAQRSVQFRVLKVCQGSELSQIAMKDDQTGTTDYGSYISALRGRKISPRPAFLENNQSIVWGGIGGFKNDFFSTTVNSSYDAKNTIKVSSPRFEYRSLGNNTSDIKSSEANIIYEINTTDRKDNSLDGFGFYHTGLSVLNTNASTVKIEYSDTSDFASAYTIGPFTNELKTGRITSCSNNNLAIQWDDDVTRAINDSQYSSSGNTEYYLKFSTLAASVPAAIGSTSYKIIKQRGENYQIKIPGIDLSDSSYTANIAGTSILLYSNQYVVNYTQLPTYNKFLRLTLSDHLGTDSFFKMGSMVAGITFGLERVPISWEHSETTTGNVTEFNSRSGVRWGYKEGPASKSFTGTIAGDVFENERRNILNITKQAMQFNVNPVVMVFDGDASVFAKNGDDPSAKVYSDPENILLGTFSQELTLTNPGWRYDETLSEWKTVGDMELTIIEVV
jgi:hypothetical protein